MLILSAAQRDELRDHAQAAYPKECCGLLIGRDAIARDAMGRDAMGRDAVAIIEVTQVIASTNADPAGGARAFEVDPALILAWHKRTRGTDARIIGHYHSHPDEPARPSAVDLARAWEPDMIWLILSVGRGKLTEIAAFRYKEEGMAPNLRRRFQPVRLAAGAAGA